MDLAFYLEAGLQTGLGSRRGTVECPTTLQLHAEDHSYAVPPPAEDLVLLESPMIVRIPLPAEMPVLAFVEMRLDSWMAQMLLMRPHESSHTPRRRRYP